MVQKLTRDEIDEHQLKGLCYNCDEKYFMGHKCKEQKLFMAISEDVPEEDVIVPLVEEPSLPNSAKETVNPPKFDPLISLHALTGFSHPQTLNLIGYIKNMKASSLLTVVAPTILFIIALPRKPVVIFMLSIIFKS
jgi:hypothetical protein